MPDDQVHASLAGGVGRVRSHAGFGNAIFAYGYAGFVGHLGEGAVAVVVEQRVRQRIVGDEDVLPAVVVVVERDDGETGRLADIGKSPVAIVVVEHWGFAVVIVRVAIATYSRTLAAAIIVAFRRPIHVVGHYQVEKAVVV